MIFVNFVDFCQKVEKTTKQSILGGVPKTPKMTQKHPKMTLFTPPKNTVFGPKKGHFSLQGRLCPSSFLPSKKLISL